MNVDIPDAALWGAAGGFISSVVVLLLGRALRHRGKLRANFSGWYFEFRAEKRYYPLHRGPELEEQVMPPRRPPPTGKPKLVSAIYGFTADLFNEKDVGIALRNVKVVFLLNGRQKISNRPFDRGLQEKRPTRVGTIHLSSREPVRIKMRGEITGPGLSILMNGCDEVRLHATREDDSLFNEHIASIDTTYRKT